MLFLDLPVFYVSTSNEYHVVCSGTSLVTSFDTEEEALAYADVDPELTVVYGEYFDVLKTLA